MEWKASPLKCNRLNDVTFKAWLEDRRFHHTEILKQGQNCNFIYTTATKGCFPVVVSIKSSILGTLQDMSVKLTWAEEDQMCTKKQILHVGDVQLSLEPVSIIQVQKAPQLKEMKETWSPSCALESVFSWPLIKLHSANVNREEMRKERTLFVPLLYLCVHHVT